MSKRKKTSILLKRYIFPGSFIPCVTAIQNSFTQCTDMKMAHMEDITPHYARTLDAWRKRFLANKKAIMAKGYGEDFIRLWDFYFCRIVREGSLSGLLVMYT